MKKEIKTKIMELAGTASLCWEPKPVGVFDSTQAQQACENIFKEIEPLEASTECGTPITLIDGYKNITDEEVKSLWNQGVCMDDWDYILVCPVDALEAYEHVDEFEGGTLTKYRPKGSNLDRLLTGACDNYWYKINFRGQEVALGVAYHA